MKTNDNKKIIYSGKGTSNEGAVSPSEEEPVVDVNMLQLEKLFKLYPAMCEQIDAESCYRDVAMEILRNGNPVDYIGQSIKRYHVGDEEFVRLTLCCVGNQCVTNCDGLHPGLTGASGAGKSHLFLVVQHHNPGEYRISGKFSPKSVFYLPLLPGTIIFLDDTQNISDDLEQTIKVATTNFQNGTALNTVIDGEPVITGIPPRCTWWITTVDGHFDHQVLNRFLSLSIKENMVHKEEIMRWQLQRAKETTPGLPENDEKVMICREMIRIMKENPFPVSIPFADRILWHNPENSRNLTMFLDTIKGFAAFKFMQRERTAEGAILASVEDFEEARKIWRHISRNQVSKLTEAELQVLHEMPVGMKITIDELQRRTNKSRSSIQHTMMGRDGKGGLIDKVKSLHWEKKTFTTKECEGSHSSSKNVYCLDSPVDVFASYDEIVELLPEDSSIQQKEKEQQSVVNKPEYQKIVG